MEAFRNQASLYHHTLEMVTVQSARRSSLLKSSFFFPKTPMFFLICLLLPPLLWLIRRLTQQFYFFPPRTLQVMFFPWKIKAPIQFFFFPLYFLPPLDSLRRAFSVVPIDFRRCMVDSFFVTPLFPEL